ncbi:hypothetical protein [Burkholderia sola]
MKVEMIELPESMAIHVEKLGELPAKAHMGSSVGHVIGGTPRQPRLTN